MRRAALVVQSVDTRAAVVRHDLREQLEARNVDPSSIDDVVLVASELVGNAVVHASAHGFDVNWQIGQDAVIVAVEDSNPEQPQLILATATDTGGRGLAIVDALSAEWGVRPVRLGKQVWARVPIAHAA